MATTTPDYSNWTPEQLVGRVSQLEAQLRELQSRHNLAATRSRTTSPAAQAGRKKERPFDPSKYSTRLIALKFAYLGKRYNGFEYHANNKTPRSTIEEELWKALTKARLIFPTDASGVKGAEVNWEGCEYSKCGRTDRGVSAFGQVIGIRVRSNRPLRRRKSYGAEAHSVESSTEQVENRSPLLHPERGKDDIGSSVPLDDESFDRPLDFHPVHDEIPYPQVLNRLLPPDIRILAWCPAPPTDFSARFSCRERQYRYFFAQPAFMPVPGRTTSKHSTQGGGGASPRNEGWLDIEAMKDAAGRFEGLHDFRNFCKIDASKQIEDFKRRIFRSEIRAVDAESEPAACILQPDFTGREQHGLSNGSTSTVAASQPKVYQFILHGSAFLWHQVRHMVAILFLIGQGLESSDLVDRLLDIEKNPRRPMYEMADEVPLVLWDCIFPREGSEEALQWVYVGDDDGKGYESSPISPGHRGDAKYGPGGLAGGLWKVWRANKIDEVLSGSLLNLAVRQRNQLPDSDKLDTAGQARLPSQRVFLGGDTAMGKGCYVPVLDRPKMDAVEVINTRYAERKGFEGSSDVREVGFRRVNIETRKDHMADEQ